MPDPMIALAASIGGGYLLGSIPFGVIVTRLGGAGDVRQIGSGNIGATNVLRTGRRDLAAITLIADGGKGAIAALVAGWLFGPVAAVLAAGAAFLGHVFPVWLKFKGGRGVATFFGTLIAVSPVAGLMSGATWIAVAFLFRISSLAGLVAAAVSPLLVFAVDQGGEGKIDRVYLAAFMAVLIYYRHAGNIRRLLKGEEPRIGQSKAPSA
ncbi:MAG: glycerol-3-phosphate 1-O-acyltransferase PlsY [Proteobacteria bacterium]|nr:glycerol-3-phosphate 1-O-acyltransferase PlsY [Pseudomonadota bacterium]